MSVHTAHVHVRIGIQHYSSVHAETRTKVAMEDKEVLTSLIVRMQESLKITLSTIQDRLLHGYDDQSTSTALRTIDTLEIHWAMEWKRGSCVKLFLNMRQSFSSIGYWAASVQRRSEGGEQGIIPANPLLVHDYAMRIVAIRK